MARKAVSVATAVAAIAGSGIMGLSATLPVALAPGMGLNACFAFALVLAQGYTWQQALAAVFLSGVLFVILSVLPVREAIINALPRSLKLAVSSGIGLFRAIIALKNAGIAVAHPATFVTLGNLFRWPALLCLLGFVLMAALTRRREIGATIMARGLAGLHREDATDYAPAVVCALAMPLRFSIAAGIGLGFITYAAARLVAGRFDQANPAVLALAAVSCVTFALA